MIKKVIPFVLLVSSSVFADGLLRTTNLNKYCEAEPGGRQTVIYLDQNIIASKDPNWYKDILNKVEYRPGEKVQFVNINNGGSTVELIWESCHPSFSPQKLKQLKENEGVVALFTGGIEDNLKSDKKFFKKQILKALSYPLQKTRYESPPSFTLKTFPKKKLVEAIYFDSKRLKVDDVFSRVIIFSDMIENSELFSLDSFEPIKSAKAVAKRFPMFLNYSSFQIYGINYTNRQTKINQDIRDFWKQYLLLSGAHVEQYGAQLAIGRETKNWSFHKYKGHVNVNGAKGASTFRMVIGDDGKIHHGWLELADMYLPLSGEVKCSAQECQVNAEILSSSNKDAFRKKDVLRLKGTLKSLKGIVGGKDEMVIDAKGNAYQYSIFFNEI